MTDDDWKQIVQWLTDHGFRVVAVDPGKRQLVLQLPQTEDTH